MMLLYTLRNLFKSPVRTLQMVSGSFLVLILLFAAYAFQAGMESSLKISGDPRNVILLGTGSEESVERSEVPAAAVPAVRTIRGLKRQFDEAAVSPEAHYNTLLQINGREKEVLIRGVRPLALAVYSNVLVVQGQFPRSGQMIAGRWAWKRLGISEQELAVGKTIYFEGQAFEICGIFAAPGSVMEAEVWMNLGDLMALTRRDSLSCITVRLTDAEFEDVDLFCKQRLDLQLTAIRETDYYRQLSGFYRPVKLMAWLTAILIAAGAFLGGMNTFYAAVCSRRSELAILQTMGFSRLRLSISLFLESLFLHVVAYLAAALVSLMLFPRIHLKFGSSFFNLVLENEQLVHLFLISLALAAIVVILPAISSLAPHLRETLRE